MDVKEFGDNLKRLRTIKGVRQEDISMALGMSRPAYAKIEKALNKNLPSHEQIAVIARAFNVDPKTLYGADKFVGERYTATERSLMEDPRSTQYIKEALAKMENDLRIADIQTLDAKKF